MNRGIVTGIEVDFGFYHVFALFFICFYCVYVSVYLYISIIFYRKIFLLKKKKTKLSFISKAEAYTYSVL